MVRNVFCEGKDKESGGVSGRCLKERKEGILRCYYYTHPYSTGLQVVIQNFTISESACSVSAPSNSGPIIFTFRKVRRDFKLRVRAPVREVKFYTTLSL